MWVADLIDSKLYAYDLATKAGNTNEDFDTLSDVRSPRGIWSDGATMWVANWTNDKIYAYSMSTKAGFPPENSPLP